MKITGSSLYWLFNKYHIKTHTSYNVTYFYVRNLLISGTSRSGLVVVNAVVVVVVVGVVVAVASVLSSPDPSSVTVELVEILYESSM